MVGVSPDDERSHGKFRKKHRLPFPLVADTDHAVCEAYGVWKEKSMFGRTFMGVERTTFLIDPEGRIARIWAGANPTENPAEVLAALPA